MAKRYSQRERAAFLEEVESTDDPIAQVARRHRVTPNTAYNWITRAQTTRASEPAEAKPLAFARLIPESQSSSISVHIGAARIDVRGDFDPAVLRRVVAALSSGEK